MVSSFSFFHPDYKIPTLMQPKDNLKICCRRLKYCVEKKKRFAEFASAKRFCTALFNYFHLMLC